MKPQTKTAAAAGDARQSNLKTFVWPCKTHGVTNHYSSSGQCVQCRSNRARERYRQMRDNPDALDAHRTKQRAAMANLRKQPRQRAKDINHRVVQRLRKLGRPKTAMPTPETLEQCLEFLLAAPEGSEMDHAIALKGIHPVTGKWVVSGLHVPCNLEPMTRRSNVRKSHWFDPENPLEFQKPYNSFAGGQFHGDIGEMEFMRYTRPTTLELMTVEEYIQAIIDAANEDMLNAVA